MKTPRTSKLPPFYTQSNGAFPRPRVVADLLTRRDEFTPERFSQIMNDLVRFCIRTQGLTGLDVVSDGEWCRPRNVEFLRRVGGFAPSRAATGQAHAAEVVVQRMNPSGSVFKAHADFLVNNTARFTRFSIPGPLSMALHYWHPEYSLAAYPTLQHLMDHLVEILFAEVHALVTACIDIIQIDEPALAYFSDSAQAASDDGEDARIRREWNTFAPRAISAINRIAEPAIGKSEIHLHCAHRDFKLKPRAAAAIDYKPLFLRLREAKIDSINVAFASQGNLEDLSLLPSHLNLGLGVLDVRAQASQSVESLQTLARAATKFIPASRIALNPECAFACDSQDPSIDEAYDRFRRLTAAAKALRAG